jgi:hypothetical protein
MVIFFTMASTFQRTKFWGSSAQSPDTRTFADLKVQVRTEKLRSVPLALKSVILTVLT